MHLDGGGKELAAQVRTNRKDGRISLSYMTDRSVGMVRSMGGTPSLALHQPTAAWRGGDLDLKDPRENEELHFSLVHGKRKMGRRETRGEEKHDEEGRVPLCHNSTSQEENRGREEGVCLGKGGWREIQSQNKGCFLSALPKHNRPQRARGAGAWKRASKPWWAMTVPQIRRYGRGPRPQKADEQGGGWFLWEVRG